MSNAEYLYSKTNFLFREVEVWDIDTETGRIDEELTPSLALDSQETFIVSVNEPTVCDSTN